MGKSGNPAKRAGGKVIHLPDGREVVADGRVSRQTNGHLMVLRGGGADGMEYVIDAEAVDGLPDDVFIGMMPEPGSPQSSWVDAMPGAARYARRPDEDPKPGVSKHPVIVYEHEETRRFEPMTVMTVYASETWAATLDNESKAAVAAVRAGLGYEPLPWLATDDNHAEDAEPDQVDSDDAE